MAKGLHVKRKTIKHTNTIYDNSKETKNLLKKPDTSTVHTCWNIRERI